MNIENSVIHRDISRKGYPIEYHVLGLRDWGFFDTLIHFLEKPYGAVVENKTEGIISRAWQLRARNEYFMVEHNEDIGNWFYTCEDDGDSDFMKVIASDLELRLKNISYE